MYKKFKKENVGPIKTSIDLSEVIADCWTIIDRQCSKAHGRLDSDYAASHSWKTIRVFVSSTFTDFHHERETLVKKVFPALCEWCAARRLHLVECDLRWGVPKDSATMTTVRTCMEELARCHQESDGQPFFINLLGDRYGWVPEIDDLSADLRERYDWVPGLSITHMEILYGAYRCASPNALFLFRDSSYLKDIPADNLSRFKDESELSQQHLQVLRQKIQARFASPEVTSQVMTYSAQVEGMDTSTGREQVKITGLESKDEEILEFFKTAIDKKYPVQERSEEQKKTYDAHEFIRELKASEVLGREQELAALQGYALGGEPSSAIKSDFSALPGVNPDHNPDELVKILARFSLQEDDARPLAVVGEPGLGKSALLAKLAQTLTHSGMAVVYHCVGATGQSFYSHHVVSRILQGVRRLFPDEPPRQQDTDDQAAMIAQLTELWTRMRTEDKTLVLVLDGLNELHDREGPGHLSWLPARTPGRLRCIVSCSTEHAPTLARLRDMRCLVLPLEGFSDTSKTLMARTFFAKYNKKLDDEQLAALTGHAGANKPLWLAVACEELRVHGDFRTLSDKISTLAGCADLPAIFQMAMTRLRGEDTTGCMDKVLSLICCSLGGVPESQIAGLLGDQENKMAASALTWATLRMFLKPFLRTVMAPASRQPRIQFFHNAVFEAVRAHVLPSAGSEARWHGYLASFYDTVCTDAQLAVTDLPHHLLHAGDKPRLVSFLQSDPRSSSMSPYLRSDYLSKVRCHNVTVSSMSRGNEQQSVLCPFCSDLRTPSGMPLRDCCLLCRSWAPFVTGGAGSMCSLHGGSAYRVSTQWVDCALCGHSTYSTRNTPQAKLCHYCSFGMGGRRCCKILTKDLFS